MTFVGHEVSEHIAKYFGVVTPISKRHRTSSVEVETFVVTVQDDEWDKQIDSDAKSGKFDSLIARARAHHAQGRTTKI